MCCDIGSKEPEVDTASDSTQEAEEGLGSLTDELTTKL